jgi:hypothetical protein
VTDLRALLDTYATDPLGTVTIYDEGSQPILRESYAPKVFAAVRAVMDNIEFAEKVAEHGDQAWLPVRVLRIAIARALS